MTRLFSGRLGHYVVLLAAGCALTLTNLGAASLWDIDEGLNAEAAREMFESGNWVVPRFNFQLRDAKPALLYWLEAASFHAFGVNEFAARFPCALAGIAAMLLTYELGRSMYSPRAGLLAGVALISSLLIASVSRFANPDALLLAATTLTFLVFWTGFMPAQPNDPPRRRWFLPFGAACGLGMLAKGPIGLVLPAVIVLIFLAWQGQLRILWDRRLALAIVGFMAVAGPWYLMVTIETRGAFAKGFFLKNNVHRFLEPMEEHRGPIYYHALVVLAGFVPWSIFLPLTLWYSFRGCWRSASVAASPQRERTLAANRFAVVWLVAYLIFFSGSATKLPNYTVPLYPALALLTARFLDGWRSSEFAPSRWAVAYCLFWLIALGLTTIGSLSAIAGVWNAPRVSLPAVPTLTPWAALGLIPIAAVIIVGVGIWRRRQGLAHAAFALTAVIYLVGLVAFAAEHLEACKAPRELVAEANACRRDIDVRLACFLYRQPSLVFYGQREVNQLHNEKEARAWLDRPTPVFVFMPESVWEQIRYSSPGRVAARRWDMYLNCPIVAVTNLPNQSAARTNNVTAKR